MPDFPFWTGQNRQAQPALRRNRQAQPALRWNRQVEFFAVLAVFLACPVLAGRGTTPGTDVTAPRIEREGIAVELEIQPQGTSTELEEGADVAFRFSIRDSVSGTPLTGLYPGAWMHHIKEGVETSPAQCREQVEEFVGGNLLSRAELDLNVYYVLALNEDATITVVDPLFGFGSTKLLELISLKSPGYDWVISADQRRVFVSQPEAGLVAVVSTASWAVEQQLAVVDQPRRIALQPDGAYLWVTSTAGELALVDTRTLAVSKRLAIGRGTHEIAFDTRNRTAWITNFDGGTVSVVDVRTQAVQQHLTTGTKPVSIAYSSLAGAAYVSHQGGSIAVLEGRTSKLAVRIPTDEGLGQIRFAPGEQYAFVVNPAKNGILIVDSSSNRVIQGGQVQERPFEVTFSDELAYIRHLDSEIVLMVPLLEIGREGAAVPVVDFPGGQEPFGHGKNRSPAPGIVQAPGATAVLVANPGDTMIYFYKEGMAAPMGGFRNYERHPKAVLVVDRSLKERGEVGVYETVAKLRAPGRYQLAFFLETPRIVHCFDAEVKANPVLEAERLAARPAVIEPLFKERFVKAGSEVKLRYRISHADSGAPRMGLDDVQVLVYTGGSWNVRRWANEVEDGLYEVLVTLPRPITYYVSIRSASGKLRFETLAPQVIQAVAAEQGAATSAHESGKP